MVVGLFGESLSPGNEQRWFWGSAAADQPGSPNLAGIKNPAIDALIEQVISAPDRDQLITRVHALDRVLLWNYYVIPQFYMGADRLAYWDIFGRPKDQAALFRRLRHMVDRSAEGQGFEPAGPKLIIAGRPLARSL